MLGIRATGEYHGDIGWSMYNKNELMGYSPSAICHIPPSVCPSLSSMIPSVMVNALPTTGIQCPNCTTICQKRRQPKWLRHETDLLLPLQWRHYGRDGVSNHQPHDSLLDRLFRRRSKETSKLRVTGLCAGNSPAAGEFPAQMASNAEIFSIWWLHHARYSSVWGEFIGDRWISS